jgi:hypothetical protein
VAFAVSLLVFVAWAYWMTHARRPSSKAGGGLALFIGFIGTVAAFDGVSLGLAEYARAHDGRVMPGVIVKKLSSTAPRSSDRIRGPRWRRRLFFRPAGFDLHDYLGRMIRTGSPDLWVVDYRYNCERPYGCTGRDIVPEELWHQLYAGQTVNVRGSNSETETTRLDGNPQWDVAVVDTAIGGSLLLFAGFSSGRLSLRRRPRYLTAPAVVTAIEPVKYGDVTRWRVRFAYFDPKGVAQESADEVLTQAWKPGDDCIAVFPPEQPALANFRPLGAA